jgi:hypothetical protein
LAPGRNRLDGQAVVEEWVRRIDEVDIDCSDVEGESAAESDVSPLRD